MKILYLLRHAHTLAVAPPLMGDHERILSSQGAEEALMTGRFMHENGLRPDFILSSSAVRTIQTAQLVMSALFNSDSVKISSNFSRNLYQASAAKILSEIVIMDQSIKNLLVVAHNPGMADLAITLGAPDQLSSYSPGTLTIFKNSCKSWNGFSPESTEFDRFFIP